ncbi:MAG: carbohydrate-binding family 9-like protein [Bacteroidia bacterium]|nr:carbohydrate-binding family 9-like protein [Bacteroidia bacterium]
MPLLPLFFHLLLASFLVADSAPMRGGIETPRQAPRISLVALNAVPDEPYYTIVPHTYCCLKASGKITVDGKMDEAAWGTAPWTEDFVDIQGEGKAKPRFRTRVKMLWDDSYFYFFAEMDEPHVWGTLTERDAVIFHDNDFEIFINPSGKNHYYYEFEMNALNTVWDLFLPKPYRDGGPADNSWDIKGLLSAVHVQGTLNDPSDTDRGWTAEVAIPWSAFDRHGEKKPSFAGKTWRVNFSRVQWRHDVKGGRYEKVPGSSEDNWVWSPQGVVDMHRPEKWGWVRFVNSTKDCADFTADKQYPYIMSLHRIYWAQKDFLKKHKRWAKSFVELGMISDSLRIDEWVPVLTPTHNGWKAEYSVLADERMDSKTWVLLAITQDSELSRSIAFDKIVR